MVVSMLLFMGRLSQVKGENSRYVTIEIVTFLNDCLGMNETFNPDKFVVPRNG